MHPHSAGSMPAARHWRDVCLLGAAGSVVMGTRLVATTHCHCVCSSLSGLSDRGYMGNRGRADVLYQGKPHARGGARARP